MTTLLAGRISTCRLQREADTDRWTTHRAHLLAAFVGNTTHGCRQAHNVYTRHQATYSAAAPQVLAKLLTTGSSQVAQRLHGVPCCAVAAATAGAAAACVMTCCCCCSAAVYPAPGMLLLENLCCTTPQRSHAHPKPQAAAWCWCCCGSGAVAAAWVLLLAVNFCCALA